MTLPHSAIRSSYLVYGIAIFLGSILLLSPVAWADPPDDEEDPPSAPSPMRMYEFGDLSIDADLGVTAGGAQDIRFFRDRVNAGEIPHANVFTPEGLFSEHDLPVSPRGQRCQEMICAFGEATDARFTTDPDVRFLAQLGFQSGIDAASFRRAPLNAVAVVDKSGSMGGAPIEMAKAALHKLIDQLGPADQLTIVLYGDTTHVHLPTTSADDRRGMHDAVNRIQIAGSTYMEAGLQLGFEQARRSSKRFEGVTRVMLFTDERPNVGNTDADSFMGMADANSRVGIGMTTLGVGVQFGAELATKISSVRGGNLFFFSDQAAIEQVFADELDTIITELAYDVALEIRPAAGMEIAGVYGIPGDQMEWTDGGGLRLQIATLFASKRSGAIYAAFRSSAGRHLPVATPSPGEAVGSVALAYSLRDGRTVSQNVELPWVDPADAALGLSRGVLLVEQATVLAEAARLHHEKNDQEAAYQLVRALHSRLDYSTDADLDSERELVRKLENTLATLSGHQGEP